ncbi:hypothetical protein ACFOEZ_20015 [Tianweitania populi]|uniref:Uncharacterized protein n=1 Tax=Tianweitania populi TaxID=1607949 RepID=A0A8J3DZ09_9HYPH|nr:hypothetical protein [Tianweitania populi]GHD21269.1 hypothetical protein GCM10016234_34750 [Tianweitania populi]
MQLTRLELYTRVCKSPLSKLAPEFGISGIALATICKRYAIPYPGSGYWTRLSLGQDAELPVLPEAPNQTIEIVPPVTKPRKKRTIDEGGSPKPKRAERARPPTRHPLLYGVEEHFRKTRALESGEFLRPYKRILPDLISSEAALAKALRLANELYLALTEAGYRVHIAPAADKLRRMHVREQEVEMKDRLYGRYRSGTIWSPDRPTVFHIDTVPVGIALLEMTERVTVRYFNGDYHREDSAIIRSAKSWQLTHSWTAERDMPSGRFKLFAYSPRNGVDWSISWQETVQESLSVLTQAIVATLTASKDNLQGLMNAADEAAAQRKQETAERWERYRREEDARKVAQAQTDSRKQLADIIDAWGRAITIERFFTDAEQRLEGTEGERRLRLEDRLRLAREMMGGVDPRDFIESWVALEERYRSEYR